MQLLNVKFCQIHGQLVGPFTEKSCALIELRSESYRYEPVIL
jgi:hypothetical protein